MSEPTFFPLPKPVSLGSIAELIDAELTGDAEIEVVGVAPLDLATPGDLTFLDNTRYIKQLATTKATACILAAAHTTKLPDGVAGLVVRNPYRAYTTVARDLYPAATHIAPLTAESAVSAAAHIDASARLEPGVIVEAGAVIGPEVEIGRGTVVGPCAVIGAGVRIGRDCGIGAHVSVSHSLIGDRVLLYPGARIGQDGFGYAMGPEGHLKVPQVGRVILQDEVEVGANSTIDRGTNRDTLIGEGTKIDNQVQIGHNVVVGRHCVLVSQSGISGSTILEDFVILGGKVGLTGHIRIGAGAQLAGGSVVSNNIPAGEKWVGVPAQPLRAWTKERMTMRELTAAHRKDKSTEGE